MFENKDKTIEITQIDIDEAAKQLQKHKSSDKKRIFANLIATKLGVKILNAIGLDADSFNNLSSIPAVLDDIDISDIYSRNVKFDVRLVSNTEQLFIPKAHLQYGIIPDVYLFLCVSEDMTKAEFVAAYKADELKMVQENEGYYVILQENPIPLENIMKFAKELKPKAIQESSPEDLEKARDLILSFVDNEISLEDKIFFYKHLINNMSLRHALNEFQRFEFISTNLAHTDEILNDSVLDVIGAQQIYNDSDDSEISAGINLDELADTTVTDFAGDLNMNLEDTNNQSMPEINLEPQVDEMETEENEDDFESPGMLEELPSDNVLADLGSFEDLETTTVDEANLADVDSMIGQFNEIDEVSDDEDGIFEEASPTLENNAEVEEILDVEPSLDNNDETEEISVNEELTEEENFEEPSLESRASELVEEVPLEDNFEILSDDNTQQTSTEDNLSEDASFMEVFTDAADNDSATESFEMLDANLEDLTNNDNDFEIVDQSVDSDDSFSFEGFEDISSDIEESLSADLDIIEPEDDNEGLVEHNESFNLDNDIMQFDDVENSGLHTIEAIEDELSNKNPSNEVIIDDMEDSFDMSQEDFTASLESSEDDLQEVSEENLSLEEINLDNFEEMSDNIEDIDISDNISDINDITESEIDEDIDMSELDSMIDDNILSDDNMLSSDEDNFIEPEQEPEAIASEENIEEITMPDTTTESPEMSDDNSLQMSEQPALEDLGTIEQPTIDLALPDVGFSDNQLDDSSLMMPMDTMLENAEIDALPSFDIMGNSDSELMAAPEAFEQISEESLDLNLAAEPPAEMQLAPAENIDLSQSASSDNDLDDMSGLEEFTMDMAAEIELTTPNIDEPQGHENNISMDLNAGMDLTASYSDLNLNIAPETPVETQVSPSVDMPAVESNDQMNNLNLDDFEDIDDIEHPSAGATTSDIDVSDINIDDIDIDNLDISNVNLDGIEIDLEAEKILNEAQELSSQTSTSPEGIEPSQEDYTQSTEAMSLENIPDESSDTSMINDDIIGGDPTIEQLYDNSSEGGIPTDQFTSPEQQNNQAPASAPAPAKKKTSSSLLGIFLIVLVCAFGYMKKDFIMEKFNTNKGMSIESEQNMPIEGDTQEDKENAEILSDNPEGEDQEEKQNIGDMPGEEGGPQNAEEMEKSLKQKPDSIDKAPSKKYPSVPQTIEVSSIKRLYWEVPTDLTYNDAVVNYLKTIGKTIKLAIQSDILNINELPYSNKVIVNIQMNKEGESDEPTIAATSGSKQIDAIVLQSVKAALKYVKAPTEEFKKDSYNFSLIINF